MIIGVRRSVGRAVGRRGAAVVAVAVSAVLATGSAAAPAASGAAIGQPATTAFIRVNQMGYEAAAAKRAYLLSTSNLAGRTFRVRAVDGGSVLDGKVGKNLGSWSSRYRFVAALDFDAVTDSGSYEIELDGSAETSPRFRIGSAENLYAGLLTGSRSFFQTQRDGADVIPGPLDRQPAHLNDRSATAYVPPSYRHDELTRDLRPVGGDPVDVEGGWFDAGDYLKFVETSSYADALLLTSMRDAPDQLGQGAAADLTDEVRVGTDWLLSMWDDNTRTLYYQVGIGDGNGCGSICGDHDLWRLPEEDDSWGGGATKWRYIRDRPALRAGPPGAMISPNLAGRLAASFALCAQVFRAKDSAYADRCLAAGEHVFALADPTPAKPLLSVSPHDYYPESQWRDDLELGATELATATAATDAVAADGYLAQAAHWAAAYIDSRDHDSLNVYDVSGLAHSELDRAIEAADRPGGLDVSQADLRADVRDQLDAAVDHARDDPFAVGVPYGYDVASHLFGLVAEATDYQDITGSTAYDQFIDDQLGAVFGANAWGVSSVVGAGEIFPFCMQHQVANLNGSRDGTAPVDVGAVVNGPNSPSEFRGLGLPSGARQCPPGGGDPYAGFSGHGGKFVDDVRAWPSVEPAIDFTASSVLALARTVRR